MKFVFRRKNMLLLGVLVLLAALFSWGLTLMAPAPDYPVTNLSEHWDVTYPDGRKATDVSLEEIIFTPIVINEVFELKHMLPADEVISCAMQIKTRHASIEVYVGDELVYADGMQYPEQNKMTPGAFHFVPLPEGYGGKMLTLRLWSNENDAFSSLEPVVIGNVGDLYRTYIQSGAFTLVASLFLIVMGILLVYIFLFLWQHFRLEMRILSSGLISFILGLYMLSYYNLPDILSNDIMRNDLVEYITLFLLPFGFMSFLSTTVDNKKLRNFVFIPVTILDLVVVLITIICHVTGAIFIDQFVAVIHMLMLVEGISMIVYMVASALLHRRKVEVRQEWKISQSIWIAGFVIMMASGMVDIARYNYIRYSGQGVREYDNLNIMTVGAFIFVFTLILNFFYYHIEEVFEEETVNRLSGLAYTDPLTDMANRARCEQILRDIEARPEQTPFTIISMDVNSLKQVNDTHGHAAGDRMLAECASILNRVFAEAELVGRMGGDEFLAFLDTTDKGTVEEMLASLEEALKASGSDTGSPYSMSYGYAMSSETYSSSVDETYRLADQRMYDMKKAHHEEREDRA